MQEESNLQRIASMLFSVFTGTGNASSLFHVMQTVPTGTLYRFASLLSSENAFPTSIL